MMAVLASVRAWQSLVKACRVVLFTDSEAVTVAFLGQATTTVTR